MAQREGLLNFYVSFESDYPTTPPTVPLRDPPLEWLIFAGRRVVSSRDRLRRGIGFAKRTSSANWLSIFAGAGATGFCD
jgi:hypothetical protein